MHSNNSTNVSGLIYLCGAVLLLIGAHYLYIWDRARRASNSEKFMNSNGKMVLIEPNRTGIHVVLAFITIMVILILFLIKVAAHPIDDDEGPSRLGMPQNVIKYEDN